MRGLKPRAFSHRRHPEKSHLLQMRGLKHFYWFRVRAPIVASFTDAWIETISEGVIDKPESRIFYRCVDWNIPRTLITEYSIKSHLLQMRGLKLKLPSVVLCKLGSHLLQMRGLKRAIMETETTGSASHLLQMRGLKLLYRVLSQQLRPSRIFYRCVDWNYIEPEYYILRESRIFYRCVDWNFRLVIVALVFVVASFTDAWIETFWIQSYFHPNMRRIFYRCVDWNKISWTTWRVVFRSHLLQMRGLKPPISENVVECESRIFYRCVDWNLKRKNQKRFLWSHLLQMRGLKHFVCHKSSVFNSRIFYRCVDWNLDNEKVCEHESCRIFYRCVDWNPQEMN